MTLLTKDESLIDELCEINSKLQIEISDEFIIASNYDSDIGGEMIGCVFEHDKGSISMGEDWTLNRDKYDISGPEIQSRKENFDSEEDFDEWLEEWLDVIVDYESDFISFYRPGIEIFSYLNEKEKKDIGMEFELEETTLYSCERVTVVDIDKLKQLLVKYELPFYFKD